MTLRKWLVGAVAVLSLSCTHAKDSPVATGHTGRHVEAATMTSHSVTRPDQVKWVDGPPSLPPGAKFAVLEGDPSREGFFAMRVTLPANYRIPPHWHPTVERVTVLSGALHLGMGERFNESAGQELSAGSYAVMPTGMRHFAWTRGETVIQIATQGPWAINYLDPADDPRKPKR
jgi:quercetin dioxygenase-like cupin family protein